MGGSGSQCTGHGNIARPVCAEEHRVQIRGLAFSHLGQRAIVHQQSVAAILYKVRDQECLLVASVSSIQWVDQGYKQNFARVLEKVLDNGEREVGG